MRPAVAPPAGSEGPIRWEARSHQQICHEVDTPEASSGKPLVDTVPMWERVAADLGEVRSLYEAAVRRLLNDMAGSEAEGIAKAAPQVTRSLTEAQELATVAGEQRKVLSGLNDELRRALPRPVEDAHPFLCDGLDWLFASDFDQADAARLDAAERARDLMRSYERNIKLDRLAPASPCAVELESGREQTIPLPVERPADTGISAPSQPPPPPPTELLAEPPTEPIRVAVTEPATIPMEPVRIEPSPPGVPALSGVAPASQHNNYGWASDFGPTGVVTDALEPDDDERVMPVNAAPPSRTFPEETTGLIPGAVADPFNAGMRVAPPTLGG